MRILHLSPHTDHLTEDGVELTKRPYPFAVDDDGVIHGRRDEAKVVGFQLDVAVQQVDVHWVQYMRELPASAVGRYVITEDQDGALATHVCAVENVEVR